MEEVSSMRMIGDNLALVHTKLTVVPKLFQAGPPLASRWIPSPPPPPLIFLNSEHYQIEINV